MTSELYGGANRKYWDRMAAFNHEHWDIEGFAANAGWLSPVVAADREAVGDVRGKTLLHLQCHFGLDTLSWARLGAEVTGIDFSPQAIAYANDVAARIGIAARFVETDLYAVPQVLDERFEVVYTGTGALCWLPDIRRWGEVAAHMLAPGGVFYIREAHPLLWALEDERDDDQLVIGRRYFEQAEPLRWDSDPVWDQKAIEPSVTYEWNHGLGEIVSALIDAGLAIELVREHQESAWQALPFMVEDADRWWRLPDRRERLPLMYSIRARKT